MHLLISLMLLSASLCSTAHAAPSGDAIVEKADEARGLKGKFSVVATIEDENEDGRETSSFQVSVQDHFISLVEQIAPERSRGRKLLMRDQDLWMFTPNIRRPVRVSLEQRLTGEVANGDLARTNYADDYSAVIEGEEHVGSKTAYRLKLTAKRPEVPYKQIDYWVDKKSFQPIKAKYYALSGKLLKTAEFGGFKPVLGKPRLTVMTIVDALNPKRRSILRFSKHKKEAFNASFFSKEALEK